MAELKPCPFCGWKAKVGTTGTFYKVFCDGAFCDVRPNTRFHKSKEEAIEAWNRRAEPTQEETIKGIAHFMAKKDWNKEG